MKKTYVGFSRFADLRVENFIFETNFETKKAQFTCITAKCDFFISKVRKKGGLVGFLKRENDVLLS